MMNNLKVRRKIKVSTCTYNHRHMDRYSPFYTEILGLYYSPPPLKNKFKKMNVTC